MDYRDKTKFKEKMEAAAKALGRNIGKEEADAHFSYLSEYPLKIVMMAIDKALRDRDASDVYLTTAILTVPEIRAAAEEILKDAPSDVNIGCEKCGETPGWIVMTRPHAQPIANRCECLLAVIASKKRKGGKSW